MSSLTNIDSKQIPWTSYPSEAKSEKKCSSYPYTVVNISVDVKNWKATLKEADKTHNAPVINARRKNQLISAVAGLLCIAAAVTMVAGFIFTVFFGLFNPLVAPFVLVGIFGAGIGFGALAAEYSSKEPANLGEAKHSREMMNKCVKDLTPTFLQKESDLPFVQFVTKLIKQASFSQQLNANELLKMHSLYAKAFKSNDTLAPVVETEYNQLVQELVTRQKQEIERAENTRCLEKFRLNIV